MALQATKSFKKTLEMIQADNSTEQHAYNQLLKIAKMLGYERIWSVGDVWFMEKSCPPDKITVWKFGDAIKYLIDGNAENARIEIPEDKP